MVRMRSFWWSLSGGASARAFATYSSSGPGTADAFWVPLSDWPFPEILVGDAVMGVVSVATRCFGPGTMGCFGPGTALDGWVSRLVWPFREVCPPLLVSERGWSAASSWRR